MTHELKTEPEYFHAVRYGSKKFEVRKNDRNFTVGDLLVLKEFIPNGRGYTGMEITAEVTYILPAEERFGIMPEFVVMGIIMLECRKENAKEPKHIMESLKTFNESFEKNFSRKKIIE